MQINYPAAESLTVEFKSDRSGYPDRELIQALTCLANTAGGELWLGVEDNGIASGLHRKHLNLSRLTALIAMQTHPSLVVKINKRRVNNVTIAQIIVPHASVLIATEEGAYLQRRIKTDGTPECIHIDPAD